MMDKIELDPSYIIKNYKEINLITDNYLLNLLHLWKFKTLTL